VANTIVELRDGELVRYRGDYAYYLQKKEEEAEAARAASEEQARALKRVANREKQKAKQLQRQGKA
jgi:ATP-binding cassette subfamily F protein 3